MSNRRKPIKFEHKTYSCLGELCQKKKAVVSYTEVYGRLSKGWSLKDALFTPRKVKNRSSIRKDCVVDLSSHKIKNLVEYCIDISNSIELLGVDEDEYRSRFGH